MEKPDHRSLDEIYAKELEKQLTALQAKHDKAMEIAKAVLVYYATTASNDLSRVALAQLDELEKG